MGWKRSVKDKKMKKKNINQRKNEQARHSRELPARFVRDIKREERKQYEKFMSYLEE